MTTTLTALGHAGIALTHASSTVLIDPWLSPEGAFQASWFPYPDNSHLITDELFTPAAIVISHEHLDHLDPWFLARVPADVPVVIPSYPSPVLRDKVLAAVRRPIRELPPTEAVEIAEGITVFFVSELSPMNHDSAVVVQTPDRAILDLNDARLSPLQLREIVRHVGGSVDVLAFQGAGASWYPICYEYPEERSHAIAAQKRMAKFAYTERVMRVVDPVIGLPFAGPPCFLDPGLARHNGQMDDGIFPDQQTVAAWLEGRGVENTEVLLPGDSWDLDSQTKVPDPRWEDGALADRDQMLREYATRRRQMITEVIDRHPAPTTSMWPEFKAYFEHLLGLSPYFNARIDMCVGFEVLGSGGGQWSVDFRRGREGVSDTMEDVGYRYRFESRWLPGLLRGDVPWEDFFLSLRFSAWREPDLYNDHLLGLLKFAHPATLEAVEAWEVASESESEWITVEADGRSYRIQRFCPHAGNDLLETGEVLAGQILRCLAHHYEFDLNTGACVNGVCKPLAVRATVSGGARPRDDACS